MANLFVIVKKIVFVHLKIECWKWKVTNMKSPTHQRLDNFSVIVII